jgi:hypothetical protein
MIWVWDTRGLTPGDYPLTFSIQPGGVTWTETVTLLPEADLPPPEPEAHWNSARSRCCTIYFINGTAAERDMPALLTQIDEQARDAVQRMGVEFTKPITITLLSRVLGQGGFADDEIRVSYLDRNYMGSYTNMVFHHEMIHILDGRLGGDLRPSLFMEGLAVYESGGHLKPEPLMPRAAALLDTETGLGWYIPLAKLADSFYLSQHEIGYLEGAALVSYMVDTWGWDQFSAFYRDIHHVQDGSQSQAIDAALEKHFNLSFPELEAEFLDALRHQTVTSGVREDLRLTVKYYDTARRYQQLLDSSAYYQNAWLVDTAEMRRRGIVADYLRHPSTPTNLALETMLVTGYTGLLSGRYPQAEQALAIVDAVLDAIERNASQPFEVNPRAADYFDIALVLRDHGYQVQRLEVNGDAAHAWVNATTPDMMEFDLVRGDSGWVLVKHEGRMLWDILPSIVFSTNR